MSDDNKNAFRENAQLLYSFVFSQVRCVLCDATPDQIQGVWRQHRYVCGHDAAYECPRCVVVGCPTCGEQREVAPYGDAQAAGD